MGGLPGGAGNGIYGVKISQGGSAYTITLLRVVACSGGSHRFPPLMIEDMNGSC